MSAKWTEWMAEILFSFDVCVCVCVQQTGQSDQFKMVKATNFKFDTHVFHGAVQTWPLKIFSKRGRGQGHVTHKFRVAKW